MEPEHRRYGSAEETLRSLDAAAEAAHRRAVEVERWAHEQMSLRGRGTALGSGVVVEVDVNGQLQSLHVRDDAARHGGQTLARAILDAQSAAQDEVRRRSDEMTAQVMGAHSPTARAVADELDERLSTPGAGPAGPGTTPGGTW